jgi:D-tyrosyl-tRNA(Tyr) deacylase
VRAVVQRVSEAKVEVGGEIVGRAERGILIYVGVGSGDGEEDAVWLAEKTASLRIFDDSSGAMNFSVVETGGSALVISQFTLLADARKGRRPSYSEAAPPDLARPLFESFVSRLRLLVPRVETGVFQAEMRVTYVNEGPVTILLDSKKTF